MQLTIININKKKLKDVNIKFCFQPKGKETHDSDFFRTL